jgi:hypothetical protein
VKSKAVSVAFVYLTLMIAGCFIVPSTAEARGYGYGGRHVVYKHVHITKYRDVYRTKYIHKVRKIYKVTYVKKIVHVHHVKRVHVRYKVVWSIKYVHILKHLPTKYVNTYKTIKIRGYGGYGHGGGGGYTPPARY